MADLFTAATLSALSGRPVTEATCTAIHTWVQAVISEVIGAIPDEAPPGVAAVALELGKAAVPPPGGAASLTIGPYSASYRDSGGTAGASSGLTHQQRMRIRRALGMATAFSVGTGAADVSAVSGS